MGHIVVMMSLWGKTLFARGMFYYGPKIHSGLSFHRSERAAHRRHAALGVRRVMLAEAVQLPIRSDTKCVNHRRKSFPNDGRLRDRNIHQTDGGEETQQESSKRGVMKYACLHDTAWSWTAPSSLSSLELLTAKTYSKGSVWKRSSDSHNASHTANSFHSLKQSQFFSVNSFENVEKF